MTLETRLTGADFRNLPYILDAYRYNRRKTREVMVGDVGVGGNNPIRVQSMTTADTLDTDSTVAEAIRLVNVGCEIVRITTPTAKDAENLRNIRAGLEAKGVKVPLVADIHFNPNAAMEAAKWADKVRINPGNFADAKRFAERDYTDEEYRAELNKIEEKFAPLLLRCKELGRSIRIGTNHGSLSDRIMNYFGDTPEGMVESALEFAEIARKYDFHDFLFSMKASNPKVMIQAYRLLVGRMTALGWDYPLHLGVTEAGNGEDGRIKSAIGIGSLLEDGLGDTIRVSLTEDPELEIPVAARIARRYTPLSSDLLEKAGVNNPTPTVIPANFAHNDTGIDLPDPRDPYHYTRRQSAVVQVGKIKIGGDNLPQVLGRLTPARVEELLKAKRELPVLGAKKKTSTEAPTVPDLYVVENLTPQVQELKQAQGAELPLVVAVYEPQGAFEAFAAGADALMFLLFHQGSRGSRAKLPEVAKFAAQQNLPLFLHSLSTGNDLYSSVTSHSTPELDRLLEAAEVCRDLGVSQLVLGMGLDSAQLTIWSYRLLAARLQERGWDYPIHLEAPGLKEGDAEDYLINDSIALGTLFTDGIGDSIQVMQGDNSPLTAEQQVQLSFNILQAAGARSSKAEFIACPSCGRTLFDLQSTTARIKSKTGHLVGVKIAIMGCIVNGLGELADADFGYMGGAPGKVNLFVGKTCVEKGVPTEEADARLIEIIKQHGRWVEPE
jgi:(E)-4-hydroxy-3-methylbut-2-enyl-diphosphate synthase